MSRRLQKRIAGSELKASVRYRVKSFESYFSKLLRLREAQTSRVRLTDLIGLRIVCRYLADLRELEEIVQEAFSVVQVERKGSEHSFREFGYDSTHMLVDIGADLPRQAIPYTRRVAEIQLRTILQDAWAEVEHEIIYKSGQSLLNEPIKRKLASLNAILTLSDVIFQEIRDEQKALREWDVRRRASLEEKLLAIDPISIVEGADMSGSEPTGSHLAPPAPYNSEVDRLVFEALAAHGNNEFVVAIQIYSRLLRKKLSRQARSIIYNHRGMAYFVLTEYRRSIEDFGRAIHYNEKNFRAYNNRALAHRILHQYELALDDLDRSIEINAAQPEGFYVRALTYLDLADFAKALRDCEHVLNIRPSFAAVQHLKTMIAARIDR
jgi:putative GTP pyrophosphokinase